MTSIKRVLLLRIILFSVATFLTVISGFILVRKLDFIGYAAYQSLNKRATGLVLSIYLLYNIWIYRDSLRLRRGTFRNVLLLAGFWGSLMGLVGFFIVFSMTKSIIDGVLAYTSVLFFSLWLHTNIVLDALRPVRIGLTRLITRLSYAFLVLLLVYFLGLGITGALVSLSIGYILGTFFNIKWTLDIPSSKSFISSKVSLSELLKIWIPRIKASIYMFLRPFILSLDVFLLIPFVNEKIVAAFFAYRVISGLTYEAFNTSLTVLHREGLKGSGFELLLVALRTAMILPIIILVYSSVYHIHIAYLLGAKYTWASIIIVILNSSTIVNLLYSGLYNTLMGLVKDQNIEKESIIIEKITKVTVIPVIPYALIVAAVGISYNLGKASDLFVLLIWSSALLLSRIFDHLTIPILIRYVNLNTLAYIVKKLYVPIIIYILIALSVSIAVPPPSQPFTQFIPQALNLLRGGILALSLYGVLVVLIDKELRRLVISITNDIIHILKS